MKTRLRKFVWQTVTIVVTLGCVPALVMAQPANSQSIAAAQALVEEAGDLMDKKNFADACPKLEQATKLVPEGVGARLALAECYEGLGRLASAQGQYLQAEALAEKAKDTRRAKEAAAEAKRLKPKLATMTLTVPEEVRRIEGVQLTWDRVAWEPALWGTPIPVDVGKHEIEVQAPGWKPWKTDVTVESNGKASSQSVPILEKLPVEKNVVPETQTTAVQTTRSWLLPVGIGIATLGLGAGIGFTVGASTKNDEALALTEKIRFTRNTNELACEVSSPDPNCADLRAILTQRNAFSAVGIAGFAVGGLAAIGTTILAIVSPRNSKATTGTLIILPSTRGIIAAGTF